MDRKTRKLDEIRADSSELENHYIDELIAGNINRREFLRRGSVIGLSLTTMGGILAASADARPASAQRASSAVPAKAGGTLRLAQQVPAAAINPSTVSDSGGGNMLAQTGEFLIFDNGQKLVLQPRLATSWKPSKGGSVWTFKIRQGVKFHNGKTLTAEDVVYTFKELSNPKGSSNALSALGGIVVPSGIKAVDASTVQFSLETPVGNFPYLVSSDNYNAIIVPAGTNFADWQSSFVGTGPFKLQKYTQNVGASFVANPHYWGPKPLLAGTQFNFYTSQPPQILALQGGDVDAIVQFTAQGAQALLSGGTYNIIKLKSSTHRELSMRNDIAPFSDARVRQAVALTLDRPGMISALLLGEGELGNDSPFAPEFPSTNTSVPQRKQNLAQAKQLLAAAGASDIKVTLATEINQEVPELAQAIQANAAMAGININLDVETQNAYYGKSTYGNSDWLDATMSLVDYGDRGVPNVFLESPLTSNGTWNAAHFRNTTYDSLVKSYLGAVDLQSQRKIAGEIQRLLLATTPIVIPYFINNLTASTKNVNGLNPTATGQILLGQASA
jgi:peptide/nickel transport system substrate-binding protein